MMTWKKNPCLSSLLWYFFFPILSSTGSVQEAVNLGAGSRSKWKDETANRALIMLIKMGRLASIVTVHSPEPLKASSWWSVHHANRKKQIEWLEMPYCFHICFTLMLSVVWFTSFFTSNRQHKLNTENRKASFLGALLSGSLNLGL